MKKRVSFQSFDSNELAFVPFKGLQQTDNRGTRKDSQSACLGHDFEHDLAMNIEPVDNVSPEGSMLAGIEAEKIATAVQMHQRIIDELKLAQDMELEQLQSAFELERAEVTARAFVHELNTALLAIEHAVATILGSLMKEKRTLSEAENIVAQLKLKLEKSIGGSVTVSGTKDEVEALKKAATAQGITFETELNDESGITVHLDEDVYRTHMDRWQQAVQQAVHQ